MDLTPGQKDALTELINIGYGRAAGAMSELTGFRISLEVPQVTMHDIRSISPLLEKSIGSDVVGVNQVFSGPISGNALLLLDNKAAIALSRLLSDGRSAPGTLDASAKETIIEVGNILLNACLGVFGNLLNVQITFSVPRLHIETIPRVLHSVSTQTEEAIKYALMVHTEFNVKTEDVVGYLVIILGIASLDRLLLELENWENRQVR